MAAYGSSGRHFRDAASRSVAFLALLGTFSAPARAQPASVEELKHLSIEELGNVEITSVAKRAQPLSRALFESSLRRPVLVKESPAAYGQSAKKTRRRG